MNDIDRVLICEIETGITLDVSYGVAKFTCAVVTLGGINTPSGYEIVTQ